MAGAWDIKDLGVVNFGLDDRCIAELRAASKDWRAAVDATLTRLRPLSLSCPHLSSRLLPGLQSLLLDHSRLTIEPQALKECGALTQLTQLHLGGPACFQLRSHHLQWVGKLTRLQDLKVRGCTKVRLSVVSHWHALTQLQSLALIGLSFVQVEAPHLASFLAAGSAASLTSLVLGDQQGLTFLSDRGLECVGQLLGPGCRVQVLDLSGCIELTDAGSQHLKGLAGSLHTLQLHNCMKLGAGTCSTIGSFSHLTALNLRGCCQLVDQGLAALLQGPVSLRLKVLNLQSCTSLSGAVFPAAASKLVSLRELSLAYCSGLMQHHLSALQQLPALEQLSMAGCVAVSGPDMLLLLGRMTRLTQLDGSGWTLKGDAPAAAAAAATAAHGAGSSGSSNSACDTNTVVDSSTDSSAAGGSSSSSGTAAQSEAPEGSSSDSSSSFLLLPPGLCSLKLANLNCSEPVLQVLVVQLPKTLTSLDLSNCRVAGVGVQGSCLKGLQGLTDLQVLNLSGTTGGLFAADMAFLKHLTGLSKLQVDHVHARPVQAVPEVTLLPWQAWQAPVGAVPAVPAAVLSAGVPAVGAGTGTTNAQSPAFGAASSSSDGAAGSGSSSSRSSTVGLDSPAVSDSALLVMDESQPPEQQQQQQPQQPQQQQCTLPQRPQGQSVGVAVLMLGQANPHNMSSSSQGSSSVCAMADGFEFPALERLQLEDSTEPASPHQQGDAAAGRGATTAAAGAAGAAAAGACGASGTVLQDADGSRRRSSLSCGRAVYRTLFAAGDRAPAGHMCAQDPAAVQADAKRFRAPSLQELQSQQQQQQQQEPEGQQEAEEGVTGGPVTWLHVAPRVQELSVGFSPGLCDAELASLGGLTGAQSVELMACHSLSGVGFSSWVGLSQLTSLTLTGCSGLTDAGLAALADALGQPQQDLLQQGQLDQQQLGQQQQGQLDQQQQGQQQGQLDQQQRGQALRELSLPGCRGITDAGVASLAALTGLRVLNLSSNKGLTDRCLSRLFPSLCLLRTLSLSMCGGLGDEGLKHLAAAPRLQTLDLHCCWRLTDEGMHHLLSSSRSLMHVHIDGCPRLSLACCPPGFVALDALSAGGRLTHASSPYKSPGVLVRVPHQKAAAV